MPTHIHRLELGLLNQELSPQEVGRFIMSALIKKEDFAGA
jgi:hypothetical protein